MNSDLKTQLRDLHVTAAKETDIGGGKKSVIVFVPVPQVSLLVWSVVFVWLGNVGVFYEPLLKAALC